MLAPSSSGTQAPLTSCHLATSACHLCLWKQGDSPSPTCCAPSHAKGVRRRACPLPLETFPGTCPWCSPQSATNQNIVTGPCVAASETEGNSLYSEKPCLHCGEKWNRYCGTTSVPTTMGLPFPSRLMEGVWREPIRACQWPLKSVGHPRLEPEPCMSKPKRKGWLPGLKAGEEGMVHVTERTSLVPS